MLLKTSRVLVRSIGAVGALIGLGYLRFRREIDTAKRRVARGSTLAATTHGPIEYAQVGAGEPLLIVHGAGGGYDQGLLCARPLAEHGFRVIAMSRFGYLRTPLPADASPQAQADAHAALLDALGIKRAVIVGASAGAPSSMQFAIRHPERCSALVLLVPLAWKPDDVPDSAPKPSAWARALLERLVGSDLLFWLTLHLSRDTAVSRVLATPPAVLATASPSEQARVDEILESILPLSGRAAGLRNDMRIGNALPRYDLDKIKVPTLVVSVRDDLYGTFASAKYTAESIPGAKFIGYDQGGHVWIGRQSTLLRELAQFARLHSKPDEVTRIDGSTAHPQVGILHTR